MRQTQDCVENDLMLAVSNDPVNSMLRVILGYLLILVCPSFFLRENQGNSIGGLGQFLCSVKKMKCLPLEIHLFNDIAKAQLCESHPLWLF